MIKNIIKYLVIVLFSFVIINNLNSVTLKQKFDEAFAFAGFDKYIELETGEIYSGGLSLGKVFNPLTREFEGSDSLNLDVKIIGNGAILDLQGKEIKISFCNNRLEIEDCIIINGNIRYYGYETTEEIVHPVGSVRYVTFYKPHDFGIRLQGSGGDILLERNIVVDAVETGDDFMEINGYPSDWTPTEITFGFSQFSWWGVPVIKENWSYFSKEETNNDLTKHFTRLWEHGWNPPTAWSGATSTPYNNIIGIDPLLVDPENGDYSLDETSPAIGYGCQTFSSNIRERKNINFKHDKSNRNIAEDLIWDADTVYVNENIDILSGSTLFIEPGVTVVFENYYHINIYGRMISEGTPGDFITFTSLNPSGFELDSTITGCWNGLNFFEIDNAENDSSSIRYSIFEYSKRVTSKDIYNFSGGAISLFNSSNVIISNNIFRNNLSYFGGAIGCVYDSSPTIVGNLIKDNFAIKNGAAISSFYSYPNVLNNTIVNNLVLEDDPFYESSTVYNYISKPKFQNNILRENVYNFQEIVYNKLFYTWNNNIEYFENAGTNGNIDLDPLFQNDESYFLSSDSPCINAGNIESEYNFQFPEYDLFGGDRISDNIIDIGSDEYSEVNLNYELAITSFELKQNYPNPFNPTTKICYHLPVETMHASSLRSAEIVVYNSIGQSVWSTPVGAKSSCPSFGTITNGSLLFDGSKFNSGIYYYSLVVDGKKMSTKSMVSIKWVGCKADLV